MLLLKLEQYTIMQKKIYDDICLYTTLLQREKNFSCDIEYRIIRELIQEAIRFTKEARFSILLILISLILSWRI